MKKLIFLLTFILSTSAFASDFPADGFGFLGIESDSGIQGPPYQKIVDELLELQKQHPSLAQTINYGTTVNGKKLALIKISKRSQTVRRGSKAIYIGGSIHGDEYLNIEDRLPRWFLEEGVKTPAIQTFLDQGGAIYIAPILNPDGYERRERENANMVDLNRDYTVKAAGVVAFKEPETRGLSNFLINDLGQSGRNLKVAMDYHCCIGALLYPWSFKGLSLPAESQRLHLEIGAILQKNLGPLRVGTTPNILGYEARGSSKDFYYEKFGALGFTFEGRFRQENKFFAEHTRMWTEIIDFVNRNGRRRL